ncbi:MAG TPA: zinc-binding alcohol dehydrogenase family protein [Rhodothermales bacterium]|nr:zinc-binding alcohol dehydrogenase family protein [Rhodothermales bacterium]
MQTLILREPHRFELVDTPEPEAIRPGEALVRVHRVGVCGTDLHAYEGRQPFFRYPRVLGHELGVEVVSVEPNDRGIRVGDRCAVEPYLNCGSCRACRRGKTNCCEKLEVLGVHTDGGMRAYLTVPLHKLHRSETLSYEQLALVEMLCIGAHAVRRAGVEPGESVLVVGAGPIGLSVAAFARAAGADVMVMERSEQRLRFCREHLGIGNTILASQDSMSEVKRAGGDLPGAVFDATGNAASMQGAFDLTAHGGTLVFVGLVQGDVTFHDPDFHRREMMLLSSRNATGEDFSTVIGGLESGQVDVEPWISATVPLTDAPAAFPTWLDPANGVIKAVLIP